MAAMQDDFIESAAQVLGRELTADEVAVVRREQSMLFLEAMCQPFYYGTATPDSVRETLFAVARRWPVTAQG